MSCHSVFSFVWDCLPVPRQALFKQCFVGFYIHFSILSKRISCEQELVSGCSKFTPLNFFSLCCCGEWWKQMFTAQKQNLGKLFIAGAWTWRKRVREEETRKYPCNYWGRETETLERACMETAGLSSSGKFMWFLIKLSSITSFPKFSLYMR